MTKDYVVDVTKITKNFDTVKALDELVLRIEPGIFGIIGPNGAGKTTLLRILLGLIRPDSGSGQVLGIDISESIKIRERIGVLHERSVFPKLMTAREYLSQIILIYGSGKDPDELLKMVDLYDARNRQIGHLSAGMHQRLGIALAFAGTPELIFLDEPTSNLDVAGREQILDLISNLYHSSGVSFVITSHILSELERVCTHVAFMNEGRAIIQGTTNEIIAKYTSDRYRIRCSDSHALAARLESLSGLDQIHIIGPSMISFLLRADVSTTRTKIEQEAESCQVHVYMIEKTATLEDAFREVIS
ncbi:MAG: ABC transporter ATP-binding protein [Candidatus Thorarchaeota archaeon]